VLADALGSTVALTNASGAVQTSYTYEPFGQATVTGAATSNAAGYTGREADGTGLAFYRARYYDPRRQRFVSEDPLGFAAGDTNLFAYVGNAPTRYTDPLGLVRMRMPPGMFPSCDKLQRMRSQRKEPSLWDRFLCELELSSALPMPNPMGAARGP